MRLWCRSTSSVPNLSSFQPFVFKLVRIEHLQKLDEIITKTKIHDMFYLISVDLDNMFSDRNSRRVLTLNFDNPRALLMWRAIDEDLILESMNE